MADVTVVTSGESKATTEETPTGIVELAVEVGEVKATEEQNSDRLAELFSKVDDIASRLNTIPQGISRSEVAEMISDAIARLEFDEVNETDEDEGEAEELEVIEKEVTVIEEAPIEEQKGFLTTLVKAIF